MDTNTENEKKTEYLNGRFRAKAKSWKLAETKGGDPQAAIDFELLEGPKTGQTYSYFGGFGEKSFEHTMKALRACGWQGVDPLELDDPKAGLDKNEVSLVIEPEEYEGKTREKVRWVNPLGGAAAAKALAPEKRLDFAQQMKAKILAFNSAQPKAAPTPPKANGSGQPAGDVPF
jgi:hypothetical protein